VISILAAFSIDSWWSVRQSAAEEQEALALLQLEFEENAFLLTVKQERLEEIKDAAEHLLSVVGPDYEHESADDEDIKTSIHTLKFWSTYDPQMGVLNGLTQSGKLGLIRSDQLRNALAAWPARIQDTAENEVHLGKFTTEFVTPYLTGKVSARNLSAIPHIGASQFSVGVESVLIDVVFENLAYDKLVFLIDILEKYDELAAATDEILRLINVEIR